MQREILEFGFSGEANLVMQHLHMLWNEMLPKSFRLITRPSGDVLADVFFFFFPPISLANTH